MDTIKNTLGSFDPISLKEMDSVKLMDRTDKKYVFIREQLETFLEEIKTNYRVLEVNGHRISRYESLYFDTKDFNLYLHHHNGRFNRYKIRFRKYVESDLSFAEVKFKNNKGRTVKKRVKTSAIGENINEDASKFLGENIHVPVADLEAKLWINFSRITFVNRKQPERLTIDMNLNFKNNEAEISFPQIIIAEAKQEKSGRSEFVRMMKRHHIREGSMSKYCLGISSLFSQLRSNNFKPQLNKFKKLQYVTATGT